MSDLRCLFVGGGQTGMSDLRCLFFGGGQTGMSDLRCLFVGGGQTGMSDLRCLFVGGGQTGMSDLLSGLQADYAFFAREVEDRTASVYAPVDVIAGASLAV